MLDKVGESFDGVISGVNRFGVFVELDGVYVSGLVHITALDYDYFHFDPVGHRLTGERTGRIYRLGDTLKVKVAAVNIDDRKIDFVLAEKVEGPGKGQGRPRPGGGRSGRPPRKAGRGADDSGQVESTAKKEGSPGGGSRRRKRRKNKG